jgi:isoleucyl-tRNA synthetase
MKDLSGPGFAPVLLPSTVFPARPDPAAEEGMCARWADESLHRAVHSSCSGKPLWVLHAGPPYANGNLHLGTALTTLLKDLAVRSMRMAGYDAVLVPGWDCHGLPVEWKVEENFRSQGRTKKDVPVMEFRKACRDWASEWVQKQKSGMQRLGVVADWDQPYLTMSPEADAATVAELQKLYAGGYLYRALRPVLWSVVEETALADAEVEYRDTKCTNLVLRFPVLLPGVPELTGASLLCWTTTPWSLPGNRAVACSGEAVYGIWQVDGVSAGSHLVPGERVVMSLTSGGTVLEKAGATESRLLFSVDGRAVAGTVCSHPLNHLGFRHEVPVLAAPFADASTGTGLVHVAPSLGPDDFALGREAGLPVAETVGPDWCVSRQRAWGVPLALFTHRDSGTVLECQDVFRRVREAFAEDGSDAWYTRPASWFLGPGYDPADWEMCMDVVDVWFESGTTHQWVTGGRWGEGTVADLCLEGSDQHRGWFQSSLLESVMTRGVAPYRALMTHGFVLDQRGKKMSKSEGNVVDPLDVAGQKGGDTLRLWVALSDHSQDVRYSEPAMKQASSMLFRFRNTLRWLLGNLRDSPDVPVPYRELPEAEKWMLARLNTVNRVLREDLGKLDFASMVRRLDAFCAVDLSQVYFEMRKDSLYCDQMESSVRRSTLTVLRQILRHLVAWVAPLAPFAAAEAFSAAGHSENVHTTCWPDMEPEWNDDTLLGRWETVCRIRDSVRAAAAEKPGSLLRWAAHVAVPRGSGLLLPAEMAEVCGVSAFFTEVSAGYEWSVRVLPAEGSHCVRCRRTTPFTVADLCKRCSTVQAAAVFADP